MTTTKELLAEAERLAEQAELQHVKRTKQLEELTTQWDEVRADREQIQRETQEREKELLLRQALDSANCLDHDTAIRILSPSIVKDDSGQWRYQTGNGKLVPISKQIVPKYLIPAKLKGGSGAPGGSPRTKQQQPNELKQAEQELDQFKAQVLSAGSPTSMLLSLKHKERHVNELRNRHQRRRR